MSPLQIGALTGVISAAISLAVFIIFLIAISFPFNTHAEKQTVIVEEGMSMEEIAVLLREDGFIGSYRMFMAHALLSGKARFLQAGVYDLSASLSIREIVNILSGGEVAAFKRVILPEGYTIVDMDRRLAENGILEEGEFIAATSLSAADAYSVYGYEFLNGIEADTLEGFMFPDTYEFRKESRPRIVVDKFLFNFEYRTKDLRAQVGEGENLYHTMIIAGLIEEEMDITSDMHKVSSVIQNRIERDMALQIDATLIYVSGKPGGALVNSDKKIDSPYNTYLYKGLPPGPITNPGLRALVAAANPADTPYIFYMSAPNGVSYFATNLAQHNAYVAQYLR
ncbi:MAG: endolytic transglycosylase MltG [Candidatus Spechtbacterales bacterium]